MSDSDVIIKVDPQTLSDQADIVNENVRNLSKKWRDIKKTIRGTRKYWKGDASDAHRKVLNLIEGDIDEILVLMSDHPNKLRKMAGIYDKAETKAAETAGQLPDNLF